MISRDLAQRLSSLVTWQPENSDRFFIPRPEIADSVFTVSDMVVELRQHNGHSTFHFNGTTEWALDSVETEDAVWLPREDQLRAQLAEGFLSLDKTSEGYVVAFRGPAGADHTENTAEAEDAYALALLQVLGADAAPHGSNEESLQTA